MPFGQRVTNGVPMSTGESSSSWWQGIQPGVVLWGHLDGANPKERGQLRIAAAGLEYTGKVAQPWSAGWASVSDIQVTSSTAKKVSGVRVATMGVMALAAKKKVETVTVTVSATTGSASFTSEAAASDVDARLAPVVSRLRPHQMSMSQGAEPTEQSAVAVSTLTNVGSVTCQHCGASAPGSRTMCPQCHRRMFRQTSPSASAGPGATSEVLTHATTLAVSPLQAPAVESIPNSQLETPTKPPKQGRTNLIRNIAIGFGAAVVLLIIIAAIAGGNGKKHNANSTTPTVPTTLPAVASGAYLSEDAQNNQGDMAVCGDADTVISDADTVNTDFSTKQPLSQINKDTQTYSSDLTTLSQDLGSDTNKLAPKFKAALGTSLGTAITVSQSLTGGTLDYGPYVGDVVLKLCVANGYSAINTPPSGAVSLNALIAAANASPTTVAPVTTPPTTLPTAPGLGISLAQEEAFIASLPIGTVTWTSAPLSDGTPRQLGSGSPDLSTFELIGPPSDLSQVDVTVYQAQVGQSTASSEEIALGEMAYQFAGQSASMWVGSEIVAAASGGSLVSTNHTQTFDGYVVEVQTTAQNGEIPGQFYVQVNKA